MPLLPLVCRCDISPAIRIALPSLRLRLVLYERLKMAGELTEDDQKKLEEETQKLTDKYVKMIDDTCASKNKEIMEV